MRLTEVWSRSVLLLLAGLLASLWPSQATLAQSAPLVGILEGSATLIRHTTRHALAEGVALNDQDIVETAPGAFVQIELPGGVLVGMGESTRLMLRPKVARGLAATPLYLLEGWLKTTATGSFAYTSPAFELATQGASTVAHVSGAQFEVFVESGTAKLASRGSAQGTMQLAAGDFAQHREGLMPTSARRAAPEFLAKVPRQFRDRLPARAERFARRTTTPKPLGDIAYPDVSAWLRTEPGLRLPLLPLWKARASDLTFRAAAKADLPQHPEWEPYADPEGYARRLAQEAERRRAREAARQAARSAGSSGSGDGPAHGMAKSP